MTREPLPIWLAAGHSSSGAAVRLHGLGAAARLKVKPGGAELDMARLADHVGRRHEVHLCLRRCCNGERRRNREEKDLSHRTTVVSYGSTVADICPKGQMSQVAALDADRAGREDWLVRTLPSALRIDGATRANVCFQQDISDYFRSELDRRARMTVVEVRANVGLFWLEILRRCGDKCAYSGYRAAPATFAHLERNLHELYPRADIRLHRCPVGDRHGEAVLDHRPSDPAMSSLYREPVARVRITLPCSSTVFFASLRWNTREGSRSGSGCSRGPRSRGYSPRCSTAPSPGSSRCRPRSPPCPRFCTSVDRRRGLPEDQ